MAQGPDGKTIIIVKKVVGHGGHHGGAWKVAYADFVTSMMCLFLVLWLVNSASVVTRERIASYFRRPGIFDEGSGTPLEIGGPGILNDAYAPPAEGNAQESPSKDYYKVDTEGGMNREGFAGGMQGQSGTGAKEGEAGAKAAEQKSGVDQREALDQLASEIRQTIEADKQTIAGFMGNITVKTDQRGLHLEIMDTPTASMFHSGSAEISPAAQQELLKIAERVVALPNPVDIEGHTDATPFKRSGYDNWDLSTDRANAARRIFVKAGMKESQIARVVGYAAQRPKNRSNVLDPANRRISISLRYTEQAASTLAGPNLAESNPAKERAQREAKQGQSQQLGIGASGVVSPVLPGAAAHSANAGGEIIGSTERATATTTTSSGLAVQLETTLPEGAVIQPGERQQGDGGTGTGDASGTWEEKELIFGKENPFSMR